MTPEQKLGILRALESSRLPIKDELLRLDVPSSTYYRWKGAFERQGIEGLRDRSPFKGQTWNQVLPEEEEKILEIAKRYHQPQFIRSLWAKHVAGEDYTVHIGALLAIELWHRLFLD